MADRKAIFIVEDEPMIGMMLEDFLETLGYAPVAIAETLVLAEEKAKSVPFDGAILDCNIGTETVWPVADYLMGKGVPILFATGGNSDEIPERFADRPSLEKPYTLGNVEIALAELFGAGSKFVLLDRKSTRLHSSHYCPSRIPT